MSYDLTADCEIAPEAFLLVPASNSKPNLTSDLSNLGSDELSLQEAIDQIAEALACSRSPLFVGVENLSTQSQQVAFQLARQSHATIDSSSDNMGRGNMFALQKRGRVTATLGEIKSRSSFVVFWFCDPVADHPDFFKQYIGDDCHTIAVHSKTNATSDQSSQFIELAEDDAVRALWQIRARISQSKTNAHTPYFKHADKLAELMKSSNYGAVIWGSEHCDAEFDIQADGLHSLVRELNQHTRFVGIPYRRDANGLSSENVSTWSSGFPFAVNWNRDSPRQHWLEYSDASVSENDEWDFLISMDIGEFSVACQPLMGQGAFQISLPVTEFGISESGDACRFDDVGITVEASKTTDAPTTAEILKAIGNSLAAIE